MKVKFLNLLIILSMFLFVSCQKNQPKTFEEKVAPDPELVTPKEDSEAQQMIKEKGTPPPLPSWAVLPQKKQGMKELKSRVNTLSLLLDDGRRLKIRPPYKIYQFAPLQDTEQGVVVPVVVENSRFWIRGMLDMYQVDTWVTGGTRLYDNPKGVEVGFVSKPIPIQVKKVNNNWIYISYEMNKACSPTYLKAWVKKSSIMGNLDIKKFPARYTKRLPKTALKSDSAMFDVFARRKGGNSVTQLPLCKNTSQILLVNKPRGKRTKLFFKPSKDAPLALFGWIDTQSAKGMVIGSCTCRPANDSDKTGRSSVEMELDYKTRVPLPIYLTPGKKVTPVGVLKPCSVQKIVEYMKNNSFASIELPNGFSFYVPNHENYFIP